MIPAAISAPAARPARAAPRGSGRRRCPQQRHGRRYSVLIAAVGADRNAAARSRLALHVEREEFHVIAGLDRIRRMMRLRARSPNKLDSGKIDVNTRYIDLPRQVRRGFPMSLAPLLAAAPEIQLHAFAAMAAFVLGVVQLAAPKGTLPHRTLGWIWVVLMLVISASRSYPRHPAVGDRGARSICCRCSRRSCWWSALLAARRHRVRAPQDHDDFDLCRRADPGGAVHAGARPDHAHGRCSALKAAKWRSGRRFFARLRAADSAARRAHQRPAKSMKKRREKPLAWSRLGVVMKGLDTLYDSEPKLTGFPFV